MVGLPGAIAARVRLSSRSLKELKVTIRCLPQDDSQGPGKCIFTGQPSDRRAVLAKAY